MFVERMLPAACKRLVTIGDDAPLIDAAKLLGGLHTDLVVVCSSDEMLAGVITKTDVVRQISHCQGSGCRTAASTIMTRTVILCHPSDLLHDVWSIMKDRGLKNIPVVGQDSRPIGVLNARDALEVLLEEVEYEEVLLREYVMCVVIVGAGFGGLEVAHRLARAQVRITIIDQRNHYLFQPLLYQVATASLAASEIAWPVRYLLRKCKEVTTLLAVVTGIDRGGGKVLLEDGGVVAYDTLVLATGARHAYFGHDEWESFAPGLKTLAVC